MRKKSKRNCVTVSSCVVLAHLLCLCSFRSLLPALSFIFFPYLRTSSVILSDDRRMQSSHFHYLVVCTASVHFVSCAPSSHVCPLASYLICCQDRQKKVTQCGPIISIVGIHIHTSWNGKEMNRRRKGRGDWSRI